MRSASRWAFPPSMETFENEVRNGSSFDCDLLGFNPRLCTRVAFHLRFDSYSAMIPGIYSVQQRATRVLLLTRGNPPRCTVFESTRVFPWTLFPKENSRGFHPASRAPLVTQTRLDRPLSCPRASSSAHVPFSIGPCHRK